MPRNPVKFTFEERLAIENGLKEGKSKKTIAKELNRHDKSIHQEVKRRSKDGVYTAENATLHSLERIASRKYKLLKKLTKEETDYITEMRAKGMPLWLIAGNLGHSECVVKRVIISLGIPKAKASTTAENFSTLDQKINALGEQIKILFETIKEMKNAKNK